MNDEPEERVEAELVDETPQPAAPLAIAEPQQALAPIVSPTEARAAMQAYIEICEAVLTDDDYQEFEQWDPKVRARVKKRFKKKSAVKKLQTFWGVTVTAPEAVHQEIGDGHFGFRVRAIAVAKDGRTVEAWGACSTQEERFDVTRRDNESESTFEDRRRKSLARAYHDVLSTAETRATNRAVMNLIGVGGGEVTADEISREPRGGHSAQRGDRGTVAREFDRDAFRKRVFAKINEYANYCDDGRKMQQDAYRHEILKKLYNKGSFNELTPEQCADFERKLDTRILEEKEKYANAS